MINFSFASVFMAVLSCNILLIFLDLVLRSQCVTRGIGLTLLKVFTVLTMTRFLFPFELPITFNIYYPEKLSRIITVCMYSKFHIFGIAISIWNIGEIIWGMGFLVSLFKYFRTNLSFYRFIKTYGKDVTDESPYNSFVKDICKNKKIHVIRLPGKQSPMTYWFLSYYILLPEKLVLEERDLYFILRHECSHIAHHDLIMKAMIQLIYMIYWWNPCCHSLKEKTDFLFELRVDQSIIASHEEEKFDYLRCLVKVSEQISDEEFIYTGNGIGFFSQTKSAFQQRFQMSLANSTSEKENYFKALLIPICIVYMLSFVYIFEASSVDPQSKENTIELTADDTYAVQKDNGTYDIYYNGTFIGNTDSLDYYLKDCKIYKNKKEALENQQQK